MQLTFAQQEALNPDMSIFVEAGAGSGKTAVLVHRFIRILQKNPALNASHIVAITFTQKAAEEMATRIQGLLGSLEQALAQRIEASMSRARISTIHGFCCQLLKRYAKALNIPKNFTVLQTEPTLYLWEIGCESALAALKKEGAPALTAYLLRHSESALKMDLTALFHQRHQLEKLTQSSIEQQALTEKGSSTYEALTLTLNLLAIFRVCLKRFTYYKQQEGGLDYTDLLTLTHQALQKPSILSDVRAKIHTVMVDEFQDTDPLQWEIIQLLTGYLPQRLDTPKPLFLVGDIRQSIYAFRGADPGLFSEIKSSYLQQIHNSTLVQLQDNFRSQRAILDWVNTTFESLFSVSHSSFSLLPTREDNTGGVDIRIITEEKASMSDEAKIITEWILAQLKKHPHLRYKDFGILLRRKRTMFLIQDHLTKAHIPSVIEGDMPQLSEEKITLYCLIKTLLTSDRIAQIRVLTHLFGFDQHALFSLYHEDRGADCLDTLADWRRLSQTMPLSDVLCHIFNNSHSFPLSKSALLDMYSLLQGYEQAPFITPLTVLKKLELGLHLPQKIDNADPKDAVKLMSIHTAKGLEFPAVILPECGKSFNYASQNRLIITPQGIGLSYNIKKEQGNLWRKALMSQIKTDILEEEKRLFYVACTRARDHLLIVGRQKAKVKETPDSMLGFLE